MKSHYHHNTVCNAILLTDSAQTRDWFYSLHISSHHISNQCFVKKYIFYFILFYLCRQSGGHPSEDLAKFGYKRDRKVDFLIKNLWYFWLSLEPPFMETWPFSLIFFKKVLAIENPENQFMFCFFKYLTSLFGEISSVETALAASLVRNYTSELPTFLPSLLLP